MENKYNINIKIINPHLKYLENDNENNDKNKIKDSDGWSTYSIIFL